MPLTLTATEAGGFDLHDADEWYPGNIYNIEETDGQWGPGLKWVIHLDGDTFDDGTQRETWAFCSQKLSPRSKLGKWLKALNDRTVDPGDIVDLTEYVGNRCQVMFERYDGFDADGNPVEKEKVTKLRKGTGKAPGKVRTAVDDEAPF